jgi:hypothetical protein
LFVCYRNIVVNFFPKKKAKIDLLITILDNKLQEAEVSSSSYSSEDLQKVKSLIRVSANDPTKIDSVKKVFIELDKVGLNYRPPV